MLTDREIDWIRANNKAATLARIMEIVEERQKNDCCEVCGHAFMATGAINPKVIRHSDMCPRRDRDKATEPKELLVADLALGDVVHLFDGAYGTGIVKRIEKPVKDQPASGVVTIERCYGTCADFSSGGRDPDHIDVIVYIGHETIRLGFYEQRKFKIYQRTTLA